MTDEFREVPLTKGHVALVDAGDYEIVTAIGPWYAREQHNTIYAVKAIYRGKSHGMGCLYLHTFLTSWPRVDHRNGDGLDNRRENLRAATANQNMWNRRLPVTNTSGFKGVMWSKHAKRWKAQIVLRSRKRHLGYFDTAEAAAHAYDAAAMELFGEFARPNFPAVVSSCRATAADAPLTGPNGRRHPVSAAPGDTTTTATTGAPQ